MKKSKNLLVFILGALLFIISINYDNIINSFFSESRTLFFDIIFSIITNFGILLIVLFVIPILINYKSDKKFVQWLSISLFISFILALIIKIVISSARPVEIAYPVLKGLDYSFPSMHAMVAFSLLPVLLSKKLSLNNFFTIFAVLIVFSRIYLGYHYLSDVVFGAFAGYFIGDAITNIAAKK
ncbi:MAG TPA: phosphatase PAP2 family protein [Candidatus Nanoarchaeia archaeon]|nr:phosphatase PAP2 family protein [Candidatus Nanoarchaeia archaeon]